RLDGIASVQVPPAQGPANIAGKDRRDFAAFYAQYDPLASSMWLPPEVERIGPINAIRAVCEGPVTYKGQAQVDADIDNFKAALQGKQFEEAFLPAASPTIIAGTSENKYYPNYEAFVYAAADALKVEYNAIVDAGFVLQIDAPELPNNYDRMLATNSSWEDYRKAAELCVEATNYALQGIPADRIRYHICWGSWNGPHTTDVPLKSIVDVLLKVNAQAY